MIKITFPNNNLNERKYILDILFNEFLEIDYDFEPTDVHNYNIVLPNGNELIIEDHFFNQYPADKEYLSVDNIPQNITFTSSKFAPEDDVVILYGNDKLEVSENRIVCGLDIFASSFFMLTRWEEYIKKERDKHDRFPAYESISYKYDFLHRPIVNEYIEMLWNMLMYLGIEQKRVEKNYSFLLTHDVDTIRKYPRIISGSKEIANIFFKKYNLALGFNLIIQKIKSHISYKYDPCNTFDYLISLSGKNEILSHFFIQIKGASKFDNLYDKQTKYFMEVINKIKDSGSKIGFHPSYNTYNDLELWNSELQYLEEIIGSNILFGRQHFLRFEVPTTWQIWDDCGMEWDSSMTYAEKEGFRCGVCYGYSVFNILTREKLKLKEKPLIVMEGSFATYQTNIKPEDVEKKIKYLIKKVKKYDGEFVFLWHNSSFNTPMWKRYKDIYQEVLEQ